MAQITINEISRNYAYSIGTSTYATIALPITASWGPGYFDPSTLMNPCKEFQAKDDQDIENHSDMLDRTAWQRFPANQAGLESFVSTYRGPIANYRLCEDYSYQMAMTLLTAGYDVLVCRIAPGAKSDASFALKIGDTVDTTKVVTVKAKYPGTFGNNLRVEFKNIGYMYNSSAGNKWAYYWNMIIYIVDGSGTKNAVENKTFVFDIENSSDSISYWSEIESDYVELNVDGEIPDFVIDETTGVVSGVQLVDVENTSNGFAVLSGGTDKDVIPNYSEDDPDSGMIDWTNLEGDAKIHAQKIDLLIDAKKWANYRYRSNGTADDNKNTGFTYAESERNYVLAFDYLMGADTTEIVNSTASYMGIEVSTDPDSPYQKLKALIEDQVVDIDKTTDLAKVEAIRLREWIFTHLVGIAGRDGYEGVYDLLKDKLAYNPQRIISPGWDDQNFMYLFNVTDTNVLCGNSWGIRTTSPIHRKLMDVAYFSRCATSMLDIPKSLDRKYVYDDSSENFFDWGYAQKLARYVPDNASFTADVNLYHTHSALFTCWGRYTYAGLTRQVSAPPAFLAAMIQRAMILNQSLQYEWILPTDRKQNLKIGKMDYEIPNKLLNAWQSTEGVGVNCITLVPGLGTTLWGNSTLYEVPPATYQALANLSTRYLMNAVEDVVYRTGVSITFQYNNSEAYSSMKAGVLPILDTMKNAGAIEDYYFKVSLDINELEQVNANSILGTLYLVIAGVVQNISIDLVALPPNTDLAAFVS